MTRNSSLIKFTKLLRESIEDGRWKQVDAARERLVQLGLDALMERSAADVHVVSAALTNARSMMILHHGVDPHRELDPKRNREAEAWMLTAEASVMVMAERLLPPEAASLNTDEQRRGRDAILLSLAQDNRPAMSNTALALRCRIRAETTARILGELRQNGLVVSWRAGRSVANQITERGREEARMLLGDDDDIFNFKFEELCASYSARLQSKLERANG